MRGQKPRYQGLKGYIRMHGGLDWSLQISPGSGQALFSFQPTGKDLFLAQHTKQQTEKPLNQCTLAYKKSSELI